MLRSSRPLASDEEFGKKKDDDFRPKKSSGLGNMITQTWRGPRRRRILMGILSALLLYFFFKNMPKNVPTMAARGDPRYRGMGRRPSEQMNPMQGAPKGPPPEEGHVTDTESTGRTFEGPIKFYELADTLSKGADYRGTSPVVFVASNLKSVSNLAAISCAMAAQKINNVHMLIVGRDNDIPVPALKEINGIDEKDCPVLWHDGRPDYGKYSTDLRMDVAAKAALGHFQGFLKAKVALIDSAAAEDPWFTRAMRAKTSELGLGLITLPPNAGMELDWITRLDATSLSAWNDIELELLIHAPVGSSGGLIRLLHSIAQADYTGGVYPKLTIELPNEIDSPTKRFLEKFTWPPKSPGRPMPESKLTLRHRLSTARYSPPDAAVRTIEAFYPVRASPSGVLVLSPDAELSPSYFHYLRFLILKYKTSSKTPHQLLGISLDMPSKLLDAKTDLSLTEILDTETGPASSFVRMQAPNSNAALYFGDKWMEFHSFISHRIAAQSSSKSTDPSSGKMVSEKYPSWLEYLLELTRLRSYYMLYPSFTTTSDTSIVTIHQELYQPPEEFLSDDPSSDTSIDTPPPPTPDSSTLEVPFPPSPASLDNTAEKQLTQSSTYLLPLFNIHDDNVDLPLLDDFPLISYEGKKTDKKASNDAAEAYGWEFGVSRGGCKSKDEKRGLAGVNEAGDLFCGGDEL